MPAPPPAAKGRSRKPASNPERSSKSGAELVIITGLSGSGKGTVLKSLEDLGFYSVDNLPMDLIPKFAELTASSPQIARAALVVDVREGEGLRRFPAIYKEVKSQVPVKLIFLEAEDSTIIRRFSETRRPHPLKGAVQSVAVSVREEREMIEPIRKLADFVIDTSRFNVHELREFIGEKFGASRDESGLLIYVSSFGFRHGTPNDADLVFDVRFLPNPNYIPEYKKLTGRHPKVAKYIRGFPQTQEFMNRITDLLTYLLPHYIDEGKSYLTIAFGCTGGHHRSVMMAEEMRRRLKKAGYNVKGLHRDIHKG